MWIRCVIINFALSFTFSIYDGMNWSLFYRNLPIFFFNWEGQWFQQSKRIGKLSNPLVQQWRCLHAVFSMETSSSDRTFQSYCRSSHFYGIQAIIVHSLRTCCTHKKRENWKECAKATRVGPPRSTSSLQFPLTSYSRHAFGLHIPTATNEWHKNFFIIPEKYSSHYKHWSLFFQEGQERMKMRKRKRKKSL